ncbi:SDR family oxidoreductase [Flavobacterium psychraquaticum]|uniref:SDR family oxidoreductase n=1 Tax=Flavobacterium psychraquaticum TaxID=3103958 RepID=UPI002ACDBDED|nr:SDR family oxidoreductase [Flavobacterium sp. LB-N7T]
MKNNKISILGCGWLGLPLAKKLIENGYEVKGSTTSESKLELLKNAGISPYQIKFEENEITGNMESFLENTDVLLVDVPPKLRGDFTENFVQKIKTLLPYIENSKVKKVLFVSSTSVYGDTFPIQELDEDTPLNPDSEGGRQLVEAEDLLRANANFKTTILRFGGLIGPERNPAKFLAGKENVANPNAPINFIHQEDCIGIICAMLRQVENDNWKWNDTFNAVTPNHPNRENYYTEKALEMNLKVPTFVKDSNSIGKKISSKKLQGMLHYSFKKQI